MRSVPRAVATGLFSGQTRAWRALDPVATALGTDCIIVVDLLTREVRHYRSLNLVALRDEVKYHVRPAKYQKMAERLIDEVVRKKTNALVRPAANPGCLEHA